GFFPGVFVPWIVLLRVVGVPFESPWHVLYIVPPGVLTWLATRPVIEGKRLTELLLSQGRYLSEPRTWCRLTPIREPREVVVVARVWRRGEAPAAVERAAIKTHRKQQAAALPALLGAARPAAEPAPLKPWRRTARDISPEHDVQPAHADLDHPPATPRLEAPAAGSGKRALASGIRRPGAPTEFWQATPAPHSGAPAQGEAPAAHARPPVHPHFEKPPGQGAGVPHPTEAAAHAAPPHPGTTAPRTGTPPPPGQPGQGRPAAHGEAPREPAPTPRDEPSAAGTPPRHGRPAPQAGPPHATGTPARTEAAGTQAHPPREAAGRAGAPGQAAPQPRQAEAAPRTSAARPSGAPGQSEASGTRNQPPREGRAAQHGEAPGSAAPPRQGAAHASGAPGQAEASGTRDQPPREAEAARWAQASGPAAPQPRQGKSARRTGAPQVSGAAGQGQASGAQGRPSPGQGVRWAQGPGPAAPQPRQGESAPQAGAARGRTAPQAGGEAGDKKVAGERRDVPRPWGTPREGAGPTRPDAPMVPGAFGARPAETPRMEPPRPWSEGLSRRPAPAEEPPAPPVPPPGEEAPPREVRSQPASPVRPRPRPPPPAPPPSGPAITPPGPGHEAGGGGLRRLFHAVGGGQSDMDAEYQQRLQQPFHGTRRVVVLGCTGGAGQTVTALMLGHTFAQHNSEPVVAIDVNPGPGALARRTRSDTNETLTGLITRADQVGSLTAMRRYTSKAKSGLDVIAAGRNPLQALDDRDYALAIRTIDKFYSVTLIDAAAAVVARVLPHADQIVLVAPASADAPRAVAMTFEWLDGHGYEELRSRAVTVINGVSRRSMDDVEQAEAVARGRCRALVRIPWDDHLSMDRAPRNELKSLRTPTRRAYLALAGVVAGGFSVMPERYQELQQEQEATR
ncbi:MAG: hypothetical protein FWJ90_14140, partial [Actinomadura sp.]